MAAHVDCTAIGDAMIDIIVRLPSKRKIGNLFDEGLIESKILIVPGGTANVASGIAHLGGKSAFVGKIGNDTFGRLFQKDLENRGIIHNLAISNKQRTGIVLSLVVDSGERFFVVQRGANARLNPEDVDIELILASTYLYFVGYSFQDPTTADTVEKLVDMAKKNNVTVCFSPGDPHLTKLLKNSFIDLIKKYVDVLFLNEIEAQNLVDAHDDIETISLLRSLGPETIILTKGPNGCIVSCFGEDYKSKSFRAQTVDTTGAGDAFAAAFIYTRLMGWSIEKSFSFCNKYAKRVVERMGPRI